MFRKLNKKFAFKSGTFASDGPVTVLYEPRAGEIGREKPNVVYRS